MSERRNHDGAGNDESENATDESGQEHEPKEAGTIGPDDQTRSDAGEAGTVGSDEQTQPNIGTGGTDRLREGTDGEAGTEDEDRTTGIDDAHEGAEVVTADGETIGIVSEVEDDRIHVDPDPGLTDRLTAKLGWENADEGDTTIRSSRIEHAEGDEVRLSRSGDDESA